MLSVHVGTALKNGFFSLLVAICTNEMRRFAVAHRFFHGISQRTSVEFYEFIALLLCLPCFEFSNLFFKIAYTLQQRRLAEIGAKCALLGGENYSVQFDSLRLKYGSVAETYHCLYDFARGLKLPRQ